MNLIKKFRKPYLAIFLSISILSTSLTSCSSDSLNEDVALQNDSNYLKRETQDISFKVKFLEYETLKNLALEVNQIQRSSLSDNEKEVKIKETLEPMILNGKEIHQEILNQVDLNDPRFELSQYDIDQIISMDDLELAQLSFVYSSANVSAEWDRDTVMSCIGVALGLDAIHSLIQNTAQLATAQGAVKVLKLLAKRYLGWLGVAAAVYSFGDCMDAW